MRGGTESQQTLPRLRHLPSPWSVLTSTVHIGWEVGQKELRTDGHGGIPMGALRSPCSTAVPVKVPQRATSVCREKKPHPYRHGGRLMRGPRGDPLEGSQCS